VSHSIKLLTIIETLGNGGAERVLVNTLPQLQKESIACEVAILFERNDLAKELERHGIKVHRLHLSYKWNVIEGFFKLNRLIRSNDYDIVHAHLFFSYFYTGLIKIFHPKIKTVTTFHNLGYNTYPANTVIKKLRKKLDAFVVNKLIDNKMAVSKAVKRHVEKHLNISQVDLVYNSFPLDKIDSLLTVESREVMEKYTDMSKYDAFSITPGRLVKEKGHHYLLEAMEKIKNSDVNLYHFIVGSGPLEEEIKREIETKKLSNITLISDLEQQKLFEFIKVCDFAVIPSVSEGFGMVVGEAMALGVPVIASNINGITDLVETEKEGLLVPSKDSNALAEAIEKLYKDKALQASLAKNAKEKIKQFDTKVIAKQWKVYYKEMLHG
jgi:glycosyltransferase involved in cell wall biosynthesis